MFRLFSADKNGARVTKTKGLEPPGGMTYCAGQALFDKDNPGRLLGRTERPFMRPEKPYELEGQIDNVCFIEGMVFFKGDWLLYYCAADSKIALARLEGGHSSRTLGSRSE